MSVKINRARLKEILKAENITLSMLARKSKCDLGYLCRLASNNPKYKGGLGVANKVFRALGKKYPIWDIFFDPDSLLSSKTKKDGD